MIAGASAENCLMPLILGYLRNFIVCASDFVATNHLQIFLNVNVLFTRLM